MSRAARKSENDERRRIWNLAASEHRRSVHRLIGRGDAKRGRVIVTRPPKEKFGSPRKKEETAKRKNEN